MSSLWGLRYICSFLPVIIVFWKERERKRMGTLGESKEFEDEMDGVR